MDEFICKVSLKEGEKGLELEIDEKMRYKVNLLKEVNWKYVIDHSTVAEVQQQPREQKTQES